MQKEKVHKEKVRVIARFRTADPRERKIYQKNKDQYNRFNEFPCTYKNNKVMVESPEKPLGFNFDDVLWHDMSQEDVFDIVCAPLCRYALAGYNGCVFCYGQTGSGKTYTVTGPEANWKPEDSGFVPRAANYFFNGIENSSIIENAVLMISCMEIYRGHLRDLNPDLDESVQTLKILSKKNGDPYVSGLNRVEVTSLAEVLEIIQIANSNRVQSAHTMNKSSSRSHAVFTFYLKMKKRKIFGGQMLRSKISFVDLAGTSKAKKTNIKGKGMKEAQAINIGLSALARVIEAVVKKRKPPLRDHPLTHSMADAFVGNTRTTLLVHLSPHVYNRHETIASCRFATRCKMVKTKVTRNKELTPAQMSGMINNLRDENRKLRLGLISDKELLSQELNAALDRIKELEHLLSRRDEPVDHTFCEEEIQRLKDEIERLKKLLELSEQSKQELILMNAMLADQINNLKDENRNLNDRLINAENIAEVLRERSNDMESNRKNLMKDLKSLKFSSNEAQNIFNNTNKEVSRLQGEIEGLTDELDHLETRLEKAENKIERKNEEILKLKEQIKRMQQNRGTDLLGIDNEYQRGEIESKDPYESNEPFKTGRSGLDTKRESQILDMLEAQQLYLEKISKRQQSDWDRKEERAWNEYLDKRAKEMGKKNGNDLLKSRRSQAKRDLKDGKIDEMPEDEELLQDIREEFDRLYDPATGTFRSDEELKEGQEVGKLTDGVDDPWEWDAEEVAKWLETLGLDKYKESFKHESVDGKMLLVDLNRQNLREDLSVRDIHADKIMREVADLRKRSPGYEDWQRSQGYEMENIKFGRAGMQQLVDDNNELGDFDDFLEYDLTEEEERYGDALWQLDEYFKILDIYDKGKLEIGAWKQGLHALNVDLTDAEMETVFKQINTSSSGIIAYDEFIRYLQFTELLPSQSAQYAKEVLKGIPRISNSRRSYVARAAMFIKYAMRHNHNRLSINNFLLNKGLVRPEIVAAWRQFQVNRKKIPNVNFKEMASKKGRLVSMSMLHKNIDPFDDYDLMKLLKRAGRRSKRSRDFNDVEYIRAAGFGARLSTFRCWFDVKSEYFNGFQCVYECTNGEKLSSKKHFINEGKIHEESFDFNENEYLISITVYLAHYITGLHIETSDGRVKLFGNITSRDTPPQLHAPQGSYIMGFYGSTGRLFESIGIYCIRDDSVNIKSNTQRQLTSRKNTKKLPKQSKQMNSEYTVPLNSEKQNEYGEQVGPRKQSAWDRFKNRVNS